jgi:hypothetical protein
MLQQDERGYRGRRRVILLYKTRQYLSRTIPFHTIDGEMFPADKTAVPDEEYLDVSLVTRQGKGNGIQIATHRGGKPLAFNHILDSPNLVPEPGGALELEPPGSSGHFPFQIPQYRLLASFKEQDNLVQYIPIFLTARLTRARPKATMNIVFQARPVVSTGNLFPA